MKYKQRKISKLESGFERLIWNFRFAVVIPVIFSLLSSLNFFLIGTLDIIRGLGLHLDPNQVEGAGTYNMITYVIGGIDYYLIGIVLLIFGIGIYELFISKIDIRFQQEEVSLFQSDSLEELKGNLVRVIVVALIVSLFKKMLRLHIEVASDLIYLSLSIFLIALSNYLLTQSLKFKHSDSSEQENIENS